MIKNEEIEKLKMELIFKPLNSKEELRDWLYLYFDILYPMGTVYPTSTHGPVDAMWRIYELFKTGETKNVPQVVMVAARDTFKTLSAAAIEVLLFVHFRLPLAHAAAIKFQAGACVNYVNSMFRKIRPYLEAHGWTRTSDNKTLIEWRTPEGDDISLTVLTATKEGFNSRHCPAVFLDELDLMDGAAFQESRMVPSMYRGHHPLVVILSTRKFATGLMEAEIARTPKIGGEIFRWNIIDVAEHISHSVAQVDQPKVVRYISTSLPMSNLPPEKWKELPENERNKYEKFEAYKGIAEHPMLPVMKHYLVERPETDRGFLYKPIEAVHNNFKVTSPEMADAQLLCFDGDAQVLMGDGVFKDIKNVNIGDIVITHKGNRKTVTNKYKRYFDGDLIPVTPPTQLGFQPLLSTPEHPFFTDSMVFKQLKDLDLNLFTKQGSVLSRGDYLSMPTNIELSNKDNLSVFDIFPKEVIKTKGRRSTLPDGFIRIGRSRGRGIPIDFKLDYDFGWIIGYFLAEGFYSRRDHRGYGYSLTHVTFCSDVREVEFHNRVSEFAKSIGMTTSGFKAKSNKGYTMDIYSASLAELFHVLCGEYSDNKKIHQILMFSNKECLKGILDGFEAGDGNKKISSHRTLTTTSHSLMSQLFTIASMFSLCPRMTKNRKFKGKQPYRVTYVNKDHIYKQNRTKFKVDNNYNQYRLDKGNIGALKPSDNYVYNIEVEGDNSYIVNGISVHNCNRPSSAGLVYPRFDRMANILTIPQAWERITGNENPNATYQQLKDFLISMGCTFIGGGDFGFSDATSLIVMANLPGGHLWLIDSFLETGLEPEDVVKYATELQKKWGVDKWYMDQNRPDIVKSLRRKGLRVPDFTKDVAEGIGAFQSRIVDSNNVRRFFILDVPENSFSIEAFGHYKWTLDAKGEVVEGKPYHDKEGYSDFMDSARYIMQNLFAKNNKVIFSTVHSDKEVQKPKIQNQSLEQMAEDTNKALIQNKMQELIPEGTDTAKKARTTKKILWM